MAAKWCAHEDVRAVLLQIALDEQRHADLAWDVVFWAGAVDEDARDALRGLARALAPPSTSASLSDDDTCGQLTARTQREAWRVAFDERVRRRLDELRR